MKKLNKRLAFTLIELLVVITIIGILATGAVTVYTTQIQKARDTTRLNDIQAVQGAVEQVYQDTSKYPQTNQFASGATINVSTFMQRIPGDPKTTEICSSNTPCDYIYISGDDRNGLNYGAYEISTGFENISNVVNKADSGGTKAGDGGDDNSRYEVGIDVDSTDPNGGMNTDSGSIDQATTTCSEGNTGTPAKIIVDLSCN